MEPNLPTSRFIEAVDPKSLEEISSHADLYLSANDITLPMDQYRRYLTPFERIIFDRVSVGEDQRKVAKDLKVAQQTVSFRWSRILNKMRYLILLHETKALDILAQYRPDKPGIYRVVSDLVLYCNRTLVARKYCTTAYELTKFENRLIAQIVKFLRLDPCREPEATVLALLVLYRQNSRLKVRAEDKHSKAFVL